MADEDTTVTVADDTPTLTEPAPTLDPVEPTVDAPPDEAPKPGLDLREEALRKANREAAERRRHIKTLEAEVADLKAKNASAEERALLDAERKAAEATEAKYRPAVVKANANAALAAAGCTSHEARKLLLKLVDTTAVEIGDDGDVVGGLDDQVEALKAQFPEKFEQPKPLIPSARQVDAGNKTSPAQKRSVGEELAARLTGTR